MKEKFRKVPNSSEDFRNLPNVSENTENHTLTVRETARLFEEAGVARTERSIINWCNKNRQGIAHLDCYFDPNEHKYFITPESVDRAIKEEQARVRKQGLRKISESSRDLRNAEKPTFEGITTEAVSKEDNEEKRIEEFRQQIIDLKITNKAKDIFINQLQQQQDNFIKQLVGQSRTIGELETKLMQLQPPTKTHISDEEEN